MYRCPLQRKKRLDLSQGTCRSSSVETGAGAATALSGGGADCPATPEGAKVEGCETLC